MFVLKVTEGPDKGRQVQLQPGKTYVIGSDEESHIVLTDPMVLKGHCSVEVGDTVCDPDTLEALPRIPIDPPTVRVRISPNTSPFAGREGRFLTSRQIGDRLRREALGNVSVRNSLR